MRSSELAVENGWTRIKLYFMLGLPTETMDDVKGIADVVFEVLRVYKESNYQGKKGLALTVSTAFFVPKAFTPFQWEPQDNIKLMTEKFTYLNNIIGQSRKVKYNRGSDCKRGEKIKPSYL